MPKKSAKEIQNTVAVDQTTESICSTDSKGFLEDINSYHFVLKGTKELENSSAHSDYKTKEIIRSIGCKTFKRILTVYFLSKKCKRNWK